MIIKVFIPILNPPKNFFNLTIPKLLNQLITVEIILINSGETLHDTDYYKVINIDKMNFNHANTRNIALQFQADFYLFMTQDATPYNDHLIEKLLDNFDDPNIVVSYAKQIPYENAHITEKFARTKNYPNLSILQSKKNIKELGIKTYFSSNSCAMYRASYFKKVDGFKKNLNGSEDMEFAARAIWDNKKVFYNAEAKVYHSHLYTVRTLYKRYFLIGRFFKQNHWIEDSIKKFTTTEATGFKFVLSEYKYILQKKPISIFHAIFFTITKYIAYKLGKST